MSEKKKFGRGSYGNIQSVCTVASALSHTVSRSLGGRSSFTAFITGDDSSLQCGIDTYFVFIHLTVMNLFVG